jgi:hypothetical protein
MSAKLKSWRRILAVRKAQCQIAIGQAADAQRNENNLLNNMQRLRSLQIHTHQPENCADGGALHAQMELGQRLVQADSEISAALDRARQSLAHAERQRTAAYIERETTDRLLDRIKERAQSAEELKAASQPRFRKKTKDKAA